MSSYTITTTDNGLTIQEGGTVVEFSKGGFYAAKGVNAGKYIITLKGMFTLIYDDAASRDTDFTKISDWMSVGGGGGSYVLPKASQAVLGGVKIGQGLSADAEGVLSLESNDYWCSGTVSNKAISPGVTDSFTLTVLKGNSDLVKNGKIVIPVSGIYCISFYNMAAIVDGAVKFYLKTNKEVVIGLSQDSVRLNDPASSTVSATAYLEKDTVVSFQIYSSVAQPMLSMNYVDFTCCLISSNSGGYTLPAATSTVLGGVKVGAGINVSSDGTISSSGSSSYALSSNVINLSVSSTSAEILSAFGGKDKFIELAEGVINGTIGNVHTIITGMRTTIPINIISVKNAADNYTLYLGSVLDVSTMGSFVHLTLTIELVGNTATVSSKREDNISVGSDSSSLEVSGEVFALSTSSTSNEVLAAFGGKNGLIEMVDSILSGAVTKVYVNYPAVSTDSGTQIPVDVSVFKNGANYKINLSLTTDIGIAPYFTHQSIKVDLNGEVASVTSASEGKVITSNSVATDNVLGVVKIGSGLTITSDGTLSSSNYEIPSAVLGLATTSTSAQILSAWNMATSADFMSFCKKVYDKEISYVFVRIPDDVDMGSHYTIGSVICNVIKYSESSYRIQITKLDSTGYITDTSVVFSVDATTLRCNNNSSYIITPDTYQLASDELETPTNKIYGNFNVNRMYRLITSLGGNAQEEIPMPFSFKQFLNCSVKYTDSTGKTRPDTNANTLTWWYDPSTSAVGSVFVKNNTGSVISAVFVDIEYSRVNN